eukprot:1724783-Amphidinium_carterae.1
MTTLFVCLVVFSTLLSRWKISWLSDAIFKRHFVLGHNYCYRRLASPDKDLVPVLKYPVRRDLLDEACKAKFSNYKKGIATMMSFVDLEWSKRFVVACIDGQKLPEFVHEAESINAFTGEKTPARDVKPDIVLNGDVADVAVEMVDNGLTPISPNKTYPFGLGHVAGLPTGAGKVHEENATDGVSASSNAPAVVATAGGMSGEVVAALAEHTVRVKTEPRVFQNLKRVLDDKIVDLDETDSD